MFEFVGFLLAVSAVLAAVLVLNFFLSAVLMNLVVCVLTKFKRHLV